MKTILNKLLEERQIVLGLLNSFNYDRADNLDIDLKAIIRDTNKVLNDYHEKKKDDMLNSLLLEIAANVMNKETSVNYKTILN